uniref:LIM zinc-binding domain-containing protein n=1 Tax=Romanomermis culicivorax TaxID=13658 RepID=A0A915K648_ROMCU
MIPRPDQNCQECCKPLCSTGKSLTPAATDMICSLPFCLGHRGKEVAGNSSCPACDKKFAGITGKDLSLVRGAGYHKTCVVCADCKKSEKIIFGLEVKPLVVNNMSYTTGNLCAY